MSDIDKRKAELEKEVVDKKVNPADDANIMFPDEVNYLLGDRRYRISELPLGKFKLFLRLEKLKTNTEESLDEVVDIFSKILNEPDTKFIEENLTVSKMQELCRIVVEENFKYIPKATSDQKKNISSATE